MASGEKTAVIVAGGQGTRIRSISGDLIPKALVPVDGTPIVFRQIDLLERYGFRRLIVMGGHLGEVLCGALQPEMARRGMRMDFFQETVPLGTAGNFCQLRPLALRDEFVVMYGDIAVEMDMDRLLEFHRCRKACATIAAHPNDHPHNSDLLETDSSGRISAILRRGHRPEGWYRNLVPAAVYVLSPAVLQHIAEGQAQDFIKDLFPRLISADVPVYAYDTPEYLRDMGTTERYAMAERDIRSGLFASMNFAHRRPAVFFDRDGVLNHDIPGRGVTRAEELTLLPGAAEAIRSVNEAGAFAIAITNQPQLAKGFTSAPELEKIHGKLETLLGMEGAKLDRIYYCPHHPEAGFAGEVPELKTACDCRKPRPGMVRRAAEELPVDLARSCVIGDSFRDIALARTCGIPAFGVRTGVGCSDCPQDDQPSALFPGVLEAVGHALDCLGRPTRMGKDRS